MWVEFLRKGYIRDLRWIYTIRTETVKDHVIVWTKCKKMKFHLYSQGDVSSPQEFYRE